MLKNILLLSLSGLFFITSVNATTTCAPGYRITENGDCTLCALGTYSYGVDGDGNAIKECSNCKTPFDDDEIYDWVEVIDENGKPRPSVNANDCPWKITCDPGYIWDKDSTKCKRCTDTEHYDAVNSTKWYTGIALPESGVCEPKIYKLNFVNDNPATEEGSIDVWYNKYNVGFSQKPDENSWLSDPTIKPSKNIEDWQIFFQTFDGYQANDGFIVVKSDGKLRYGITEAYYTTDNANFYAQYRDYHYIVSFMLDGNQKQEDIECKMGKNFSEECKAVDCKRSPSGKYFVSWKIKGTNETVLPNQVIRQPTIDELDEADYVDGKPALTLEAVFSDCPAGYYCQDGNKTACPGGATSNAGATSIYDCYIKAGNNGTEICDNNGCFNLSENIYYLVE